jgi:hypothetical protein
MRVDTGVRHGFKPLRKGNRQIGFTRSWPEHRGIQHGEDRMRSFPLHLTAGDSALLP